MPDLQRTLYLATQELPEGLWLAEALHLPIVSRIGPVLRAVHRELLRLVRQITEESPPGSNWRLHGGGAAEGHAVEFELRWTGERELAERPIALSLPAVRFRREDGPLVAYLPALGAHVAAGTPRKLEQSLELEVRRALKRTGIERDLLRLAILARTPGITLEPRRLRVKVPTTLEHRRRGAEFARSLLQGKPVLPQVASQLRPRRLRAAYEADPAVEQVARALGGDDPASVLLVGPPGVGKSAVAFEVVRRAARLGLDAREFWETSGSRLGAGASGFGQIQERCRALAREARERRALLLLGNLFELLQVGRANECSESLGPVLQPLLTGGRILAIAECTPEQADRLERSEPRVVAAFHRVVLREPDEAAVGRILDRCAADSVRRRRAVIDPAAIDAVQRLHGRFAGYSAFPGKAVHFLQSLVTEGGLDALVGEAEVVAAFAEQSGLPAFLLDDAQALDVAETRAWFGARIFGQPEAVDAVVDLVVAAKAGLGRTGRPLASLFFVGPTGVGKTETAKALAGFFFRDRARITRFDMSEFSDPHAVLRLIGTGAAEGLLTAKVREQPFQLLLLDEIEKADPGLFDLLLQVLGEGRLTDAAGRTADFRNAVVVLTSNLGAESFRAGGLGFGATGGDRAGVRRHFEEEVRRFFRPELFNRIDRIVPFLPLGPDTLRALARRELDLVRLRSGVLDRRVPLDVPAEVVDRLVALGTHAAYGARPLKRALERALLVPLAHRLNDYAWDQPLETRLEKQGTGVAVTVRGARVPARPTPDPRPAAAADLDTLSDVRRRLHRFFDHPLFTRLEDEIVHLQEVRDRMAVRGRDRRVPAAEAARLRLLDRMLEAQRKLRGLQQRIEPAEEEALLDGLGLGGAASPPPPEAAPRDTLIDGILSVLELEVEEPDVARLWVRGEVGTARPRLVAGLADAAHRLGATQVRFHVHRRAKDGAKPRAEATAKGAVRAATEPDVVALEIEVHLVHARLLLESEQGTHYFIEKRGSYPAHVTLTEPPPAEAATPARGARTAARREYDFEAHRAKDRDHGEMLFTRTGLGILIAEAVRRSVERRIEELTEP